jgi:Ser/Thr protein kinase RdoA (MazF antagonist)
MDISVEALESARVGQPFRSRKNRVFKVVIGGDTLVAKVFPPDGSDRARSEYATLQACVERQVRVPHPVKLEGRVLVMEYVTGRTAAEAVDSPGSDTEQILRDVVDWLSGFHAATSSGMCRGDCVLHNFLMASEGVVGIDFEEAHRGNLADDLGEVIASYLSMRPQFVEGKFAVARRVASEHVGGPGRDGSGEVPRAVASALRHYGAFRKDGDVLREWADWIEREGLVLRE